MRAVRPRRTVRLRLTILYGALFLASGTGLLAITNAVAATQQVSVHGTAHRGSRAALHQMHGDVIRAQAAVSHQFLVASIIALAVMAAASIALGWIMAGRVLRPLADMTTATRAISQDNLHQRLAVAGPGDELKDLGDTIDGLLGRLESAFGAQRRFAASASHELRTPLAMMRTSLDVATAKPAVSPEVTVLAGKLREGLDQADRLVEGLLLLARAQHDATDDQETVSLGHLLAGAIEARAGLITRMGLRVRQDTADAWVSGNATLLARMAGNIIDNAIRYNQPDGQISAQATVTGAKARLVVENGGPILEQDTVTGLAQPFRRLGTDRTGSADGTGLGLSIVEAIASAHGGTLHLHARPQGGLCVVIELPRAAHPRDAAVAAGTGAGR